MPVKKWTAEDDRKLFVLIVNDVPKLDYAALANHFPGRTPKALKEHIFSLRKTAESEGVVSAATGEAVTVTKGNKGKGSPKKSAATATPSNSNDDVDDDDEEGSEQEAPKGKPAKAKAKPKAKASTKAKGATTKKAGTKRKHVDEDNDSQDGDGDGDHSENTIALKSDAEPHSKKIKAEAFDDNPDYESAPGSESMLEDQGI